MRDQQYDILLVDDDIEDRMILRDAFADKDCGDRVTMYSSGFEFLQQFPQIRLFSPVPILIILDYNLDGANADLILKKIKEDLLLKNVPVIIYTSFCTAKLHDECLEKGAFDCVEKGNTYQQVLDFATAICNYLWGMKKSGEQEADIA
jgi:two-component system chemotaxis response regulator CheY